MAIKIRKAATEEKPVNALEPEVLPPEGSEEAEQSEIKLPGFEDDFLKKSGNVMGWLMEHRRMVIFVVIVVLGVAFGYLGVRHYQESIMISRSSVMSDVFITYTAPTKAQADADEARRLEYMKSQGIAADAPDILRVTYTVPDDDKRFAAIENHLKTELPKHKGESIMPTGDLMLAGTTARRSSAEAAPIYDEARKSENPDVQLFAVLGQTEMLVGEKKYDEAIARLDELIKLNSGFSSYATLEKGRIYEMKGEVDKAIAAYDQVMNEFNQPVDQQKAGARLRILTPDWASHMKAAPAPAPAPAPQVAL